MQTTVNLDSAQSAGQMNFASGPSLTLSGSGMITLDNGAGTATINLSGTHSITAPLTFNSNTVMTVSGTGDLLTLGGYVYGSPSLTKAGSGTLVISGYDYHYGGTTISGGSLVLQNAYVASPNYIDNASLDLSSTGSSTMQLYGGSITGSGNLLKSGSGTVTLGYYSIPTARRRRRSASRAPRALSRFPAACCKTLRGKAAPPGPAIRRP